MFRQALAPVAVKHFMADVCQIGSLRAELLDNGERFRQTQMCRMRAIAQRVEHEDFDTAEEFERRSRDRFGVGDVRERPTTESIDRPVTVPHRDRDDPAPEQFERPGEFMQLDVRLPTVKGERVAEGVPEPCPKFAGCLRIGEHRNGSLPEIVELTQIVEPTDVIGMRVREQDGVEARQAHCERLEAQLRCSVDQNRAIAEVQDGGTTSPAVAWVDRRARTAPATDHRYPVRCPSTQECQPQHGSGSFSWFHWRPFGWSLGDQLPARTGTDDTPPANVHCRWFRWVCRAGVGKTR